MTYVNPRAKVLRHLDRLVGWQMGQKPAPVTVEWDLSNRCTLGCASCHFSYTHVKGPWAVRRRMLPMAYDSTGDLADLALVHRGLREMRELGVQSIVWSGGGEPTTHPQWIGIVEDAASLGFQQGMYTHGGLLTPETATRLAKVAAWVVVSLDAHTPLTYGAEKGVPATRFWDACNGITSLIGHQAIVGVSFLLHGANWTEAHEMLALARSLGATYTTFRPAIQTSPDAPSVVIGNRRWLTTALDESYYTVLKRMADQPDVEIDLERFAAYRDWTNHGYATCEGVRLNTTITPDGRVWVCPQRRGVTALGDLRTESFAEIWAKHPGRVTVDDGCRAMCRLHPLNEQLAALSAPLAHEAFL